MGFIIVPGIGGSGDAHWQTHWERDLAGAVRIAPSSWDEPQVDDWLAAIDIAASRAGSDAVIVAHSMGCLAAAEWLARSPAASIAAVLLVAPPDSASAAYPREAAGFGAIGNRPVGVPGLVLYSDDDPYGSAAYARRRAAEWRLGAASVGSLGHVNSASDLASWPQGRAHLAAVLAGSPV